VTPARSPRFSVLTTVFNPEIEHLRACVASVAEQTWTDYEHIVVDDGSNPEVGVAIANMSHERLRSWRHEDRRGIVGAAQTALSMATGEFVVLLDHDDVLVAHALERVADHLLSHPGCEVVYSDHDLLRADDRCTEPFFKPDFSPERLRQQNYITHLVVASRQAVESVGGFRSGFDGSQDHDLLLRLSERVPFDHIREVLYHWRQSDSSVSTSPSNKLFAFDHGLRAVAEHCQRVGIHASVEEGAQFGCYRIRRLTSPATMDVVIRASGREGRVWASPRRFADIARSSIAGGSAPGQVTLRESLDVKMAVNDVRADIVLFADERSEMIDEQSLMVMVALLDDPGVAAVGPMLLSSDGTVRSAGLTTHGWPADILRGWAGDHPGPGYALLVEREVSAVRTAVIACRAADASLVADAVAASAAEPTRAVMVDAALGAALRSGGRRMLWTPHASWYWFDDTPVRAGDDMHLDDPYYNPNLVPGRGDWLERPGLAGASPYFVDEGGVRRYA
jgi:O-antigen biosynthesis protein